MSTHPEPPSIIEDPAQPERKERSRFWTFAILGLAVLGAWLGPAFRSPQPVDAESYRLAIDSKLPEFDLRVVETERTDASGTLVFYGAPKDDWDATTRNLCAVADYALGRGARHASLHMKPRNLAQRLLNRFRVNVYLTGESLVEGDPGTLGGEPFDPAEEWELYGCDARLGRFIHRQGEEWDLPGSTEIARLPWWNPRFGARAELIRPRSSGWQTCRRQDGAAESCGDARGGGEILRIFKPAPDATGGDPIARQLHLGATLHLLNIFDQPIRADRESLLFEVEIRDADLDGVAQLGLWIDNGGEQPFFVPESEPPKFRSDDYRRRQIFYFPEDGEEIQGVSGGLMIRGEGAVEVRQARLLRTPPWEEIRQRITVTGS